MFEELEDTMFADLSRPPADWAQANFFTPLPPRPVTELPLAKGVVPRNWGTRWYQDEAHEATVAMLTEDGTALNVMATGTGKSVCFSRLAAEWDGTVGVFVHRKELVDQAQRHLERMTGELVEIEKAESFSSPKTRIVVCSVQSMNPARLQRLGRNRFSLLIIDEAHRYLAPTWRRAVEYFEAKKAGYTATPDRGDEQALGQLFGAEPAYVFDIQQGVEAGYLVPLLADVVEGIEVDLSGVGTTEGDFVQAELDEEMVKHVEGIVKETLRLHPTRRGIFFFPGVKSAELACQRLNALRPGSACFVCGETEETERDQLIRDFKAGVYRYLCNCNITTEGFDDPTTDMIVMGRPTKSRALAAQMIGRGTRVLDGTVDHVPGKEGAAKRRALIASSAKPDVMILDFVSTSIGDALITPADVMGGNFTPEEIKLAKEKAAKAPGGDVLKNLQAAREQLRIIALKAQSKVRSQVRRVNPFEILGVEYNPAASQRFGFKPPSEAQIVSLGKSGFKPEDLAGLSRRDVSRLFDERSRRMQLRLCSFGHLKVLGKYGITEKNVTWDRASDAMTYIKGTNWRPDPKVLNDIIFGERQPGEDG